MKNLDVLYDEFLDYMLSEKNASSLTIDSYRRDYNVLTEYLVSKRMPKSLDMLTTQNLRNYVNYMKKVKDYSSTTINRKINSLRSFAKFLVINEYMDVNFMDRITAPKKEKKLPKVMKEEELEKFLSVIMDYSDGNGLRDRAIFNLYASTGIRRQELINLNIEDVDLGNNTLKILNGKGGRDRVVPLFEPTSGYLWEYLMTRLPVKDNKEPLFKSGYGNRISVTAIQQLFRRYMKIAGLNDKGYTIHTLRHTYATLILKNGGNLMEIKDLLGHADLNSTSIYLHTTVEQLRKTSKLHPLAKRNNEE
ncbi:tyrosine-type recombinase/integrase [Clostridium cochlearium]|uniref:tyrosine-type recombinase/integrase n=1 Tax=Clostridium cochlearium TaxID=1494 RepID=UPI000BBCAB1B|nr:tyrosine-type recombinase/integrase [Clostridium cochlearium]